MSVMTSGAAGAGMVALFELDAASIGPFLLSRPIVIGPLIGWAFGAPWEGAWTGAAIGGVFEALTLEELPLGGCLDFSAPVAAGVAAWLAAGPAGLPMEAAFLAGLAAGWVHARVESELRRGRGAASRRSEARLAAGREPHLGARIVGALGIQAAATFLVALAAFGALGPALMRLWPALPGFLRDGARTGFMAAPWIGAGSLVSALGRRL